LYAAIFLLYDDIYFKFVVCLNYVISVSHILLSIWKLNEFFGYIDGIFAIFILFLHEITLETPNVIQEFRVHGKFLSGDLFRLLKVSAHIVVFIVHHSVLKLGDNLTFDCDQVSFLFHALEVIVEDSFFSLQALSLIFSIF